MAAPPVASGAVPMPRAATNPTLMGRQGINTSYQRLPPELQSRVSAIAAKYQMDPEIAAALMGASGRHGETAANAVGRLTPAMAA